MHRVKNTEIGFLYLILLFALFGCKSDGDMVPSIEINIISPIMGEVYPSDSRIEVEVEITSNMELSAYRFEVINFRHPGYYYHEEGSLSSFTDTITSDKVFRFSTTTRKTYSFQLYIELVSGDVIHEEIGFQVLNMD